MNVFDPMSNKTVHASRQVSMRPRYQPLDSDDDLLICGTSEGPWNRGFSLIRPSVTADSRATANRRGERMPRRFPVLPLLASPAAPLAAAGQPIYSYTVIGGISQPPPSGPISLPLALNNNGRVVGYGYNAGGSMQALNWK